MFFKFWKNLLSAIKFVQLTFLGVIYCNDFRRAWCTESMEKSLIGDKLSNFPKANFRIFNQKGSQHMMLRFEYLDVQRKPTFDNIYNFDGVRPFSGAGPTVPNSLEREQNWVVVVNNFIRTFAFHSAN